MDNDNFENKYFKKYLKYKEKYKLAGGANSAGGGSDTKRTQGVKIKSNTDSSNKVIDRNWSNGSNKNPIHFYNDTNGSENQTFFIKTHNDNLFFVDKHKLCISDKGRGDNLSPMVMDVCNINDPNQQFKYEKIDSTKFVYKNESKNKCLDSNNNNGLIYYNCDKNNPNQQFKLIYTDVYEDIDIDAPLVSHLIHQDTIDANKDKVKRANFINTLKDSKTDFLYRTSLDHNHSKTLVVNFNGRFQDYNTIFRLSKSKSNIMLFRDRNDLWYHTKLQKMINEIKTFVNMNSINQVILFGVSMGGYASLYCANFIDNCICIAINPQTFPKTNDNPYYIYHQEMHRAQYTTDHLLDLRKEFESKSNTSKKYILTARSDHWSYPESDGYWHDTVHSGYLMGLPNIVLVFIPINAHSAFEYIDPDKFFEMMDTNYNELNDMNTGKHLLNNIVYFKIDRDKPK